MKTLKELEKFALELTNVSSLATLQKELIEFCEISDDDSDFVQDVLDDNESLKDEREILKSEVKRLEGELKKWPQEKKSGEPEGKSKKPPTPSAS